MTPVSWFNRISRWLVFNRNWGWNVDFSEVKPLFTRLVDGGWFRYRRRFSRCWVLRGLNIYLLEGFFKSWIAEMVCLTAKKTLVFLATMIKVSFIVELGLSHLTVGLFWVKNFYFFRFFSYWMKHFWIKSKIFIWSIRITQRKIFVKSLKWNWEWGCHHAFLLDWFTDRLMRCIWYGTWIWSRSNCRYWGYFIQSPIKTKINFISTSS